jgi:tRNA(Ile)-lysidine synthase
MISIFSNHLQQKFPDIHSNSKLLIAFSGGLDSVVLAELLYRLDYDISLAHVNFSLRKQESDADADFTDHFAQTRKIPIYQKKIDTRLYADQKKLSIQQAAREIRYHWFDELIEIENLDYILTAHHADDQVETVFINMIRGTGLKGFTGIPERRENIIRPLLPFAKKELLEFAKKNNMYWREDSSNQSTDYLRNQVRHHLMPHFKSLRENAFHQARKSINLASASYQLFDDLIQQKFDQLVEQKDDIFFISISLLKRQKQVHQLLFHFISRFGFTDADEVYKLSNKPKGKFVQNKNYCIIKERDYLVIKPVRNKKTDNEFTITKKSGIYEFPFGIIKVEFCQKVDDQAKNIAYLDADQLDKSLILRKWEKGDIFQPYGMKGKKKVSDFLKDEKIAHYKKQDQWVLLSNNQIVWIVNHRIDERFKIKDKTKRCLKISYSGY